NGIGAAPHPRFRMGRIAPRSDLGEVERAAGLIIAEQRGHRIFSERWKGLRVAIAQPAMPGSWDPGDLVAKLFFQRDRFDRFARHCLFLRRLRFDRLSVRWFRCGTIAAGFIFRCWKCRDRLSITTEGAPIDDGELGPQLFPEARLERTRIELD